MKTQIFKTTFIVLMASFFGQFQVSGQVAVNKKQIAIVWPAVLSAARVDARTGKATGGVDPRTGKVITLKPQVQVTNAYLNKTVRGLTLTHPQLNDEGLKIIPRFQQVIFLKLKGCYRITDAGLKEVAKLKNLEYLDLWACVNITDAGLREISKLQKLRHLDLANCNKITDAGLKHFAKMQNLQFINISNTNISDAGLKELAKIPGLRNPRFQQRWSWSNRLKPYVPQSRDSPFIPPRWSTLWLYETKTTRAGRDQFQRALPKCFITGP